jgi:hypothetical protein
MTPRPYPHDFSSDDEEYDCEKTPVEYVAIRA